MTDAEIICTFMEPRPTIEQMRLRYFGNCDGMDEELVSVFRWWRAGTEDLAVEPNSLTFDRLHEVEARLTGDGTIDNPGQWKQYDDALIAETEDSSNPRYLLKSVIHASAPQKIKALAAVLRSEVEARS